MRRVRKLTIDNKVNFFDSLRRGDAFTYSQTFLAEDVIAMAAEKGLEIHYCKPHTHLYRTYGCRTFYVRKSPNDLLGKTTEDKVIDGIMAVADEVNTGNKPSLFHIAMIMVEHLGDDAKSIIFSEARKVNIHDDDRTER